MVILLVVTKTPKVEPDWAALAARYTTPASLLVAVGYCAGMIGAISLVGLGVASYWSAVNPGSPLFWVAFLGMLAGFSLMGLGESVKRAARKGEGGR